MEETFNKNSIRSISDYKVDSKIYVDKFKFSEAIINILKNSIEAFVENSVENRVIIINSIDLKMNISFFI